ncbi:MAG: amidase family protein [Nocardioidaceae bacterium]
MDSQGLKALARRRCLGVAEYELADYQQIVDSVLDTIDGIDTDAAEPVSHQREGADRPSTESRDAGRHPSPGEDPLNAVVRWCDARRDIEGPLSGVRVAVKDSMAVAGVPMTCGSRVLQGFVPTRDSVVVDRVLNAGGEIVAMANMDDLAFSGGGDSSFYGPTLNPFDAGRTAGGSSSGSAAGLHYDRIDMALGTDQGGSIRVPAAWCGVLGLKPTYGLVPYTRIAGLDHTLDHVGPMARTTLDLARLLQVVAGRHESDPRQRESTPDHDYVAAVTAAPEDLAGIRIAAITEGFGVEEETTAMVRTSIRQFESLGAIVTEHSLPEHRGAAAPAFALFAEGMNALVDAGGNGYHWKGRYWPELAVALGRGLRTHADELSAQMKVALLVGSHLRERYFGSVYATAQNRRENVTAGYERAFDEVDFLVMPTVPTCAHANDPSLPLPERVLRGWAVLANTTPTNLTGHPAITLPIGEAGGLPVGAMVVGPRFSEPGLLALAATYERRFGWQPMV